MPAVLWAFLMRQSQVWVKKITSQNWNASGTKSVNHTTEEKFQDDHLTYVQLLNFFFYTVFFCNWISGNLKMFDIVFINFKFISWYIPGTPWHTCIHTCSSVFIRRWWKIGLEHINGYHLSYCFFENRRKQSILKLLRIKIINVH